MITLCKIFSPGVSEGRNSEFLNKRRGPIDNIDFYTIFGDISTEFISTLYDEYNYTLYLIISFKAIKIIVTFINRDTYKSGELATMHDKYNIYF